MGNVKYLIIAAAAYLLGALSFSIIVCRLTTGKDIRTYGSGNAGLTNFYRTFGGPLTLAVILCDVLKAVIAVWLGTWLLGQATGWLVMSKYWAGVFCLLGEYTPGERGAFLLIMAAGILASLLLGAAVGAGSGSQMAATSVTVPVMLLFSFLPMFSTFNSDIAKVAKYTYTEQIRLLLDSLGTESGPLEGILIIAVNMILFAGLFCLLYRRQGFRQGRPALTKN